MLGGPRELTKTVQGVSAVQGETTRLRSCMRPLGQMLEGRQRLREERHRWPVGGYSRRPLPSLAKIGNRLWPQSTEKCMGRERVGLLGRPNGAQPLAGWSDRGRSGAARVM